MKRGLFVALVSVVALGTAGCGTFARKAPSAQEYRPRAFALAVTVNGVLQPTPQQWAAVQAVVAQNLALHGWVLVTDLALADHIIRIDFTPNPNDPENSGHAQVLGLRKNPRIAIASTTSVGRYPTSFSYLGTFQNASWGYGGFSNNYYYGWGNSYYDGYSYGSANLNPSAPPLAPTPRPTHPPHRHNPGSREDCPPLPDNYIRPRPSGPPEDHFAGTPRDPARPSPSGERGHWRGGAIGPSQLALAYARADISLPAERTTWRSDSANSRPERTHSRAEASPSRIERAQWRGGSADSPRSERTYARNDSSDSRPERSHWRSDAAESGSDRRYTRSNSSESRPERTYSRGEGGRSWQDRSDASSSRSEHSYSRPERSYSRSDSSDSARPERTYSRSDSSGSERTYSRSESSHSRSDYSHSRSDSSHSRSHSSESASSSPPPAPAADSSAPSPSSESPVSGDPAR